MIHSRTSNPPSKPFFLVFVALVLFLFAASAPLFVAAVFAASAIGLWDLFRMVTRINTIRFSLTLAMSILLAYGLGTAIYLATNATFYAAKYQYWAPQGLLFDQSGLSMGLAACLLASAALYVRASFERPTFSQFSLDSLTDPKSEWLVWLGVAMAALAVHDGAIGYMGAFVSETRHVSPLGVIANLIVPPLVPYTLVLITSKRSRAKRAGLIVALLFFIGVLSLLGRRHLLYVAVLSAVALRLRSSSFTKRGSLAAAAFALLAVVGLYWGFKFFMALRFVVWEVGPDAGLLELVLSAFSQLGGAQATVVQEALAENIGSRPFVLSYLGGLVGISASGMPSLGQELLYSLQMSIPSILMPGKLGALPPMAEALVHPLYGIPTFDGASSFLVTGFDDFGFIGAAIYPLGAAMLYYFFYRGLRTVVHTPSTRLFILFTLMFQLLYVEQSFGAVFVTLRDLTIVIVIASCLRKLPAFRLVPRQSKRPAAES